MNDRAPPPVPRRRAAAVREDGVAELMRLPGLGPRRARTLQTALGISTLPALRLALRDGRVGRLAGFSDYMAQRLLKSIDTLMTSATARPSPGRSRRRRRPALS